jgi:TetR/AcrR family transcriptional regulator, transcriptional repressor of aconitase
MPKVSQEHRERRRQQILDAARECFRKQGFHNTSMQDIFKASGLSAGAVYRYFPSKHQLVREIALGSLSQALGRLDLAGAPAGAVTYAGANAPEETGALGETGASGGEAPRDMADIVAALAGVFAVDGPLAGIRPIVMQVWAEAGLDPEMATIARDVLSQLMEQIEAVLPPGVPPEVARLLMATVQGFLVQSLVFEDVTEDLIATTSRAAFR